ncbi:4-diphosphocytidyl-2c-methyl-D-erythritol kinase [Babesia ovata]|uniref:4-diphosphocytidyl-2c-methyl-D-erythritol kinase n=1 Tax=Babesia ovata TaxID=189622 RepID=A0A2H6KCV6_9APIC|nr:4-diphosphocytidyl-2c-methyl-D-erythritol kinase [Babesia ovata]GBE60822.1 4-diphosphocytidyl-2c-methyl-D-erythritol kinase [Babesia ovata]
MKKLVACLAFASHLGVPATFHEPHRNFVSDDQQIRKVLGCEQPSPGMDDRNGINADAGAGADNFWDYQGVAFAKVNLTLQIDPDAEVSEPLLRLSSLMHKVSWGDYISIKRLRSEEAAAAASSFDATDDGDVLLVAGESHPSDAFQPHTRVPCDDSNIVAKALRKARKPGERYVVLMRKRVPPGSGLGGGSADAGFVLRALRTKISPSDTLALGSDVGFMANDADVALVTGKGEDVAPIDPLDYEGHIYILVPDEHVSTAEVFKRARELLPTGSLTTPRLSYQDIAKSVANFHSFRPFNVLERCVQNDGVKLLLETLRSTVPSSRFCMSGSGGACYVLDANDDDMVSVRERYGRNLLIVKARLKRPHDNDADFSYL